MSTSWLYVLSLVVLPKVPFFSSCTLPLSVLLPLAFPFTTRTSSVVTLARPPTSSSLKITDRSFRYASPCLWNNSLHLFINLILVPVPLFSTHVVVHLITSSSFVPSPCSSITTLSFTLSLKPTCFTNTSRSFTSSCRLPSRTIARTVSSELLGFCF